METYLFYSTHLIMFLCIAVVISASMPENTLPSVKKVSDLANTISLLKNAKKNMYAKALMINILSIGIQISNQLLK